MDGKGGSEESGEQAMVIVVEGLEGCRTESFLRKRFVYKGLMLRGSV